MFIYYDNDTGLSLYLQFDDNFDTALPFVEGIGAKTRRYTIDDQMIINSGLIPGSYYPTIRVGDYQIRSSGDPIKEARKYNWNGKTETLASLSGGGVLLAQIGIVSLTTSDFLEIVQGEEKIITFIVQAHGRFDTDVFGNIIVKLKDPAGTVITKTELDGSIERVCQAFDVQVIRCILSPEDTTLLVAGLLQIELMFDNQKARLTHSLKVLDQIIDQIIIGS